MWFVYLFLILNIPDAPIGALLCLCILLCSDRKEVLS